MRLRLPFLLLAFVAACAPSRSEKLGVAASDITNGTLDKTDASVVLIVIDKPPSTATWSGCTGTVVSPHVVLTAAHCISSSEIAKGYRYRLFWGDNLYVTSEKNDLQNWGPDVVEAHAHPNFAASGTMVVNDVGVLITKDALALTPVPLRRTPLAQNAVGADVRIVGFGQAEAGVDTVFRASATTKVSAVEDTSFNFIGTPGTCEGDSGGPSFMTENGVESLAGVHSGGTPSCDGTSIDMRVDAFTSFIDSYIQSADGPPVLDGGDNGNATANEGGAAVDESAPATSDGSSHGCAESPSRKPDPEPWIVALLGGAAILARRRRVGRVSRLSRVGARRA